jgi:hypothetical protein
MKSATFVILKDQVNAIPNKLKNLKELYSNNESLFSQSGELSKQISYHLSGVQGKRSVSLKSIFSRLKKISYLKFRERNSLIQNGFF